MHYPKVLLLCSLSQNTANGITIANLFKCWPVDRIALAEFNDPIEDIYVPGIRRYYIIGAKESRFIRPFGYLRKMRASASHDLAAPPERSKREARKSGGGAKAKLATLQANFLHRSGLAMVSRSFTFSPEFRKWVEDFGPDFIYCTGGDICKLEFLQRVIRDFKVPGAIHIFDDYINSKHEGTWFPRYWRKRLDTTFRATVNACGLHLAIGDKMADEYTGKYGKRFHGFHNPIDPAIWCRNEEPVEPLNPEENIKDFSFLYAGKINKDTVGPIRRFMEAVQRLREQGHAVRFGIHSPYPFEEIQRLLGENAEEVYLGRIPYAELPNAFRSADALLLPLDFTEATIKYIRLSMLTKATEYMISGTPIFCFAPDEIAVTEYLLRHEAAYHCNQPGQLEDCILEFIRNGALRCELAANAVQRAREHHLMEAVNERLRGLIAQAVGDGSARRSS